ncbi:MAG: Chromate transport protein [Halanaerobium sp. 4-GBenrich]|jgi:chromate transporter|uniref:Chromate transporter n=1 Tax=Halanaerobium congolense TaxID=54121 RepID=A0A1G6QQ01_9FIRM|nr:chromate transporter [Halanaerobium congolense]ODS49821.1 MAG: Chromate transport protein [Halanaerobium sp. 4-GBenrich]OEG62587.1 MAG: chromate transporter [Halanaerobium sp. MDAL1]PUU92998.1 MAG: Chromate transport protein [Halanaerobium sp.]PTX16732.1 chromate transporter [Halanaerobium congolense]PXV64334.1 chromate transporter [Halanaerobium congolense]
MIYLTLFFEFFKVGLFALGGGLAALPFLQDLIIKYGWMTAEELLNMIAISESTPGAIGINTATFIGYNTTGIAGGITATLGLAAPSIIIIIIIAHYFQKFNEHPLVESAFSGIRPAVAGLIASAAFELAQGGIFELNKLQLNQNFKDFFDYKSLLLLVFIFIAIRKFKQHPIVYIVFAAVIGIIFKF